MRAIRRTLAFAGFTLLEYLRSGRVIAEILATVVTFYIFMRRTGQGIDADYFFAVAGVFGPVLTIYTMSVVIGLADRPQSYLLLVRRLGRSGFLTGLLLVTLTLVGGAYGLLCLATALLNRPAGLDLAGWAMGTLPLLLNVALLASLLLLLSPLVLSSGWRLFVLALIATAFSSNFVGGPMMEALPEVGRAVLRAVQAILGGPLVPAFYGYQIGVSRDYADGTVFANLLAQLSLALAFFGLALYAFNRRDLVLSSS